MRRPCGKKSIIARFLLTIVLALSLMPLQSIGTVLAFAEEGSEESVGQDEDFVDSRLMTEDEQSDEAPPVAGAGQLDEASPTTGDGQFYEGVPFENLEGLGIESLAKTPLSPEILASIPAYFVSPYATAVKNQQQLGTCWAFASIAAMEADANKDNLDGLANSNADYPNYSELAQAYHTTYGINPLLNGSHPYLVALQAIRGIGPVWENSYPGGYPLAYPNDTRTLLDVSDSLSRLSSEWASKHNAALAQGAYFVNIADTSDIKQLILDHGAAAVTLHWSDSFFSYPSNGYPAYYHRVGLSDALDDTGHAVTIIGWDDSYAVANFETIDPKTGAVYRPSMPGAWLIKNSWGEGDPREYIWVSYEGTEYYSATRSDVIAYDMVSKNQYDEIQQVGRGGQDAPYEDYWLTEVLSANIYRISTPSTLDAIGFYSTAINTRYNIKIYRNIPAGGMPDSGTLTQTIDGLKRYAGYDTITLDTPINLDASECYSVVLTLREDSGDGYLRYYENETTPLTNTLLPELAASQSFFKWFGNWSDCFSLNQSNPIKTYINHKGLIVNSSLGLKVGESASAGKATGIPVSSITWTSSDSSVATVDGEGNVVAVKRGSTTVQAVYNGQVYTCNVSVSVNYLELYGQTRYKTASAAVQAQYLPKGSVGVILATGENYPDALTASALAGLLDYPIMLTNKDRLQPALLDDIIKLKGSKDSFHVILVGSAGAISADVEASLKGRFGTDNVIRLGGATRYETAIAIYQYGQAQGGWGAKAFICVGDNFPDALSATGYAFARHAPLFIMDSSSGFSQDTINIIKAGGFTQLVVLGSTGAVPDSALAPFAGYSIVRNGGPNRYDTSLTVAQWCVSEGMSWNSIGFATGTNYPDALTGGTMQGKQNGFIILVSDTAAGMVSLAHLPGKDIRSVSIYGGTSAISQSLRNQIQSAIG